MTTMHRLTGSLSIGYTKRLLINLNTGYCVSFHVIPDIDPFPQFYHTIHLVTQISKPSRPDRPHRLEIIRNSPIGSIHPMSSKSRSTNTHPGLSAISFHHLDIRGRETHPMNAIIAAANPIHNAAP